MTDGSKHTPGPWTIEPFDNFDKSIVIREPGVAVDNDDVNHAEAAANARLIAAAPDLLAALRECLTVIDPEADPTHRSNREILAQARAAIAKATQKEPQS